MSGDNFLPGTFSDRHKQVPLLWLKITAFLTAKSYNTQITYKGIINEWCHFIDAQPGTDIGANKFLAASDLEVLAYKKWLEKQPGQKPRLDSSTTASKEIQINRINKTNRNGLQSTLTNSTISKKFAALRRIYRMCLNTGLDLKTNPFDGDIVSISASKSGLKRPTEMVDFNLVTNIMNLPDRTTAKGRRDHAVLALLFGGGLRRSEVTNLKIGDFQKTQTGTYFIYLRATKSKKDFRLALPEWAVPPILTILEDRQKNNALSGDPLIVAFRGQAGKTPTNQPISSSSIYKLFKFYCNLAGVEKIVSPHSARATAITKLLSQGLSHREVQEFSRHSSIQMVEVYDKRRIEVDQGPGKILSY